MVVKRSKVVIEVIVKTSSKSQKIEKRDSYYFVSLKSKPHNNSANKELIDVISNYFNIPKSSVNISLGLKNKKKLVEIDI